MVIAIRPVPLRPIGSADRTKPQTPNPEPQRNTKRQTPTGVTHAIAPTRSLKFGTYLEFGVWNLGVVHACSSPLTIHQRRRDSPRQIFREQRQRLAFRARLIATESHSGAPVEVVVHD